MPGRRCIQRSVRLSVASGLLAVAATLVVMSLLTGAAVRIAAVAALLAGAAACRIVYAEVVQTRALAAQDRAKQARAFEATVARNLSEHADFTKAMAGRLQQRDRTIRELHGTLRLAERRAVDAESRVRREARRANEAQERLSVLLDEVAAHQAAIAAEAEATQELSELPTIVDLLAWEERVTATISRSSAAAEAEADLPREA